MARVKGLFQATGNMKGISLYTRRGSDEVIVRTKGGPSKSTIDNSDSCVALRNNSSEWSGCTKAASTIRRAMEPILRLADYNVMGSLNAMCKKIQQLDTDHEKGQRHVLISQNNHFIADLDFNKVNPFERVVKTQASWTIDRKTVSATINIPKFNPSEQLRAPNKLPLMRFVATLGVCTNVYFDQTSNSYYQANKQLLGYRREVNTAWNPVKRILAEQQLLIKLEGIEPFLTADDSLVLTLGIEFGTVGADGQGEAVKWAGCGKALGCV